MHVIRARNPQQALPEALRLLDREGRINSANMLVVGEPVTTVYAKPCEAALFWNVGKTSPARHLLDGLRHLAKQSEELLGVASTFRAGSQSCTLRTLSKTTHLRTNRLDEIDLLVGRASCRVSFMYGPDFVADSLIQQFVAAAAGGAVGQLWQISYRFSGRIEYRDHPAFGTVSLDNDPYHTGHATVFPLVSVEPERWVSELRVFVDEGDRAAGYTDPFFRRVALPLLRSQRMIEDLTTKDRLNVAGREVARCAARDWQLACLDWINEEVRRGPASKEPTA